MCKEKTHHTAPAPAPAPTGERLKALQSERVGLEHFQSRAWSSGAGGCGCGTGWNTTTGGGGTGRGTGR